MNKRKDTEHLILLADVAGQTMKNWKTLSIQMSDREWRLNKRMYSKKKIFHCWPGFTSERLPEDITSVSFNILEKYENSALKACTFFFIYCFMLQFIMEEIKRQKKQRLIIMLFLDENTRGKTFIVQL